MKTQVKDSYFAGLIDGEGCLSLYKLKGSAHLKPTIEVKMTCHETIKALQAYFGGAILFRPSKNERWLDQWRWRVSNASARNVLSRIYPFLITKKKDAEKLITYSKERGFSI